MPKAVPRARVTSSGAPAGSTPRAMPFGTTGQPSLLHEVGSGPSSAPSVHTSEPSTSTGRRARASSSRDPRHGVGVRLPGDSRRRPGAPFGRARRQGRAAEQGVHGDVQEHRAAVSRRGERQRVVGCATERGHVMDGRRRLGDRRQQRRLVELLEAPGAPAVVRCPPAEHDQRRAVEPRGRHRGDAVGDAGAGGQHGQARRSGQLGVASAANTAVCSCRTSSRRTGGSACTAPS